MLTETPKDSLAILVTIGGFILECTILDFKEDCTYGKNNKSGVTPGKGPGFSVQHNNKQYVNGEWVTYTGANRWKKWGKTWIEPQRLFPLTDIQGAIQFGVMPASGAGAGAGYQTPPSRCSECKGNKKHKRMPDGTWCPKSKRAQSAEKLKFEGDKMF